MKIVIIWMIIYQKTDKYHGFLVKIYPFEELLLGKKKDPNNRAQVNPLPP